MAETEQEMHAFDGGDVAMIRALLETGRNRVVADRLNALHASDVADLIADFEPEEKARLFSLLQVDLAADVLAELDGESRDEIIELLSTRELQPVLEELEPDDAADVIGELEPGRAIEALAGLEDRREIESLLAYPADTAGGLMTTDYVHLPPGITVREAIEQVRASPPEAHRDYLFVTDSDGRPVGRVPLAKLVFSPPEAVLAQIMEHDVRAVAADMDREEVGEIVRRYDLLSVPVVEPATGRMLGLITVDDVIDAVADEAAEDMYRLAGTGATDPLHQPVLKRALLRLPWLLITLVPGFLVGQIMRWLGYNPGGAGALLLFVPVMIAMAGNVSIQSSTVMVRGLATGDVRSHRILSILSREILVAGVVGLGCALIAGTVGALFFGGFGYGVVIAFSMFCGILVAAVTGTSVPIGCHAVGVDPAIAAGPFVTSMNDITGTLIFLGIGARLLALFQ